MLPEFEKIIPKPPKKRYRDLFADDGKSLAKDNSQNVSRNCVGTFAFSSNTSHIPVIKENINCQLHAMPTSYYRKSVIKRSITKHISIIDFEEISATLTNNVNALNTKIRHEIVAAATAADNAKLKIDYIKSGDNNLDENRTSRIRSVVSSRGKNYIGNSPGVKFSGKLKVKWREKYENVENYQDDFTEHELIDSERKKAVIIEDKIKTFSRGVAKNSKISVDENGSQIGIDKSDNQMVEEPPPRKLERARKGLIYQKFMASSYSWNRKDKSTKNSEESSQQPRKRGRPRTVTENRNEPPKSSSDELNLKSASLTLMRLAREKNSRTLKYTVVADEKSKSPSHTFEKKSTGDAPCIRCGLTIVPQNNDNKFSYSECKCYVTNDFGIIFNDIRPNTKKRKKMK